MVTAMTNPTAPQAPAAPDFETEARKRYPTGEIGSIDHWSAAKRAAFIAGCSFALASSSAERSALEKRVGELEALVYIPGLWRCAKCGCSLISTNLHVQDGGFSANKEPQQCPNDCGPMWRVTERQAGNDLVDRLDKAVSSLAAGRQLVAKQAEDDGLWFQAKTAPEAYLQQELRRLHSAIEGELLGAPGSSALAAAHQRGAEAMREALDRRMREVSTKSEDARRRGDDAEMFKLNTAWHWLDATRRDLDALPVPPAGEKE